MLKKSLIAGTVAFATACGASASTGGSTLKPARYGWEFLGWMLPRKLPILGGRGTRSLGGSLALPLCRATRLDAGNSR